jgi:hypothetical protein
LDGRDGSAARRLGQNGFDLIASGLNMSAARHEGVYGAI